MPGVKQRNSRLESARWFGTIPGHASARNGADDRTDIHVGQAFLPDVSLNRLTYFRYVTVSAFPGITKPIYMPSSRLNLIQIET
jgi:hypothetical protein